MKWYHNYPALLSAAITAFFILILDFLMDLWVSDPRRFWQLHLVLIIFTLAILYFTINRHFQARKLAEHEGLTNRRQLANILNTAADAILAVDQNLNILVFNRSAEQLFGYSASKILQQPLNTLWPDRLKHEYLDYFAGFANSQLEIPPENRRELIARRSNGTEFPAEVSVSTLLNQGPVTVTIVLRNITIRKQAEEALRWVQEDLEQKIQERTDKLARANSALETEISERKRVEQEREQLLKLVDQERRRAEAAAIEAQRRARELDAVFSAMNDGVIVYDAHGIALQANPAAMVVAGFNLVGGSHQDIRKKLLLRHPDGQPVVPANLPSARAFGGNPVPGERFILSDSNGQDLIVLISASPLAENGGDVTGAVVVVHDITQHEHLQADLHQALTETQKQQVEISGLLSSARVVLEHQNFDTAAAIIFATCKDLIDARGGYIALLADDQTELQIIFEHAPDHCEFDTFNNLPFIKELTQQAYLAGQPVFHNFLDKSRLGGQLPAGSQPQNILLTPLIVKGIAVGVLALVNKSKDFSDADSHMVTAFGELIAISLLNTRTMRSLENSEARFRSVVQAASEAIIVIDSDGNINLWNQAATEIFGYSATEVSGQNIALLMPESLTHFHISAMNMAKTAQKPNLAKSTVELTGKRKNNQEFPLQLSISSWNIEDEVYFTGIIQDITARKQAAFARENARLELEKRVQERTQQLANINKDLLAEIRERERVELRLRIRTTALEAAANGVIITDANGIVRWANPAITTMTGYGVDEVIGQDMRVLKSNHHTPEFYRQLWQTILAGHVWSGELVNRRKDGSFYTEGQTITPVLDKDNHITHFIAIKQDITERVQAYQLLEQRVQERTHELSTLLEISGSLALTRELEPRLQLVLNSLKAIVDYNCAAVYLLKENSLEVLANRSEFQSVDDEQLLLSLQQAPVLQQIIHTQQAAIIVDSPTESVVSQIFTPQAQARLFPMWQQVRSWLGVPLLVKDRVIGILEVRHSQPDYYTNQQIKLTQAFASQVAVTIENHRLNEQAQELAAMEERQRLSRDLHDAVSQTLFSASLAADVLPVLWKSSPQQGEQCLVELQNLTKGALAEMRTLLLELRPTALTDSRLDELLQQLVTAIKSRTRIPIQSEISALPDLPPDVQVALYRIAQEALNNTVKHAQAKNVLVTLSYAPLISAGANGNGHNNKQTGQVELSVRDDGLGFNLADIPGGHLGLGIMRERAQSIGAALNVTSHRGAGTEITIVWPQTD